MKTMNLAWAIAMSCAGLCSQAAAADQPSVTSSPDIQVGAPMTPPPAIAPGKSPPQDPLQPSHASSTNAPHALGLHTVAAARDGSVRTNAVAEPADKAAMSATATAPTRAADRTKPAIARRKFGGIICDVFTTRDGYKLLNPFAPVRNEQEDNTVYDPITGKPSGVSLINIQFSGK